MTKEEKSVSIIDTLLDNAVYCIMTAMKIERDIKNNKEINFTNRNE